MQASRRGADGRVHSGRGRVPRGPRRTQQRQRSGGGRGSPRDQLGRRGAAPRRHRSRRSRLRDRARGSRRAVHHARHRSVAPGGGAQGGLATSTTRPTRISSRPSARRNGRQPHHAGSLLPAPPRDPGRRDAFGPPGRHAKRCQGREATARRRLLDVDGRLARRRPRVAGTPASRSSASCSTTGDRQRADSIGDVRPGADDGPQDIVMMDDPDGEPHIGGPPTN